MSKIVPVEKAGQRILKLTREPSTLGMVSGNIRIVTSETPRQNQGVQGGQQAAKIDLSFEVEI